MVLSDLLDLKLSFPPENKETHENTKSNEQSSSAYTLNLSGVNLDSFFAERMENTTAMVVPTQTHTVVQEKQSTNSRSHGSSSLEVHSKVIYSTGMKTSSQNTNQIEVTPAFANWDADFQSVSSEDVSKDSKKANLFNSALTVKTSNFPAPVTSINPVIPSGNETDMKSMKLEDSKDLASASGRLVKDESNSGIFPENSSAELNESSLSKSSMQSDQLPVRGDTGASIDEAFDDWQELSGGNEGSLSNSGEHMEGPIESNPSEIKTKDTWLVSSMESCNNVSDESADDWQAFTSSSGQGGDLMKPIEGPDAGQGGGLVKPVGETTSISLEHYSEANPVDLWPVDNIKELHNTEVLKETNDSFDDWQDFTTSGQAQSASHNQVGGMMEVSHATQKETDDDSWFTADVRGERNNDLLNSSNVVLDDVQGLSGSDLAQQSSLNISGEMMNISFGQHEVTDTSQSWMDSSNSMGTNMATTNTEDNSFDIWQDFTTLGHQKENFSKFERETTTTSSEPAKQSDPMDLWLTSNAQESNSSKDANRIDDSGGWQDFANFGQIQSTSFPGVGHSLKDSSGAEPLDLWASTNAAELKNHEQTTEDSDPFDDWQDFKNSRPLDTNLQVPPDASIFDNPSVVKPDVLQGLEFGSFAQLIPSQSQIDNKDNSNEANTVSSDEHLGRMKGDVDSLSSIWPTTSHDTQSVSKPESVDANVERLLSQMHDLSFMLKVELSIPDKPVDHSKP
uniref:Dentin sialophosphoprotein-like n=2 Tax=Oryza brachyantha TaxID=4533 RepID=J3MTH3_ORYBR